MVVLPIREQIILLTTFVVIFIVFWIDEQRKKNENHILNKIFITRPLPPEVLKKAQTLGEVTARNLTSPLTTKEMTEALQNFDIILPTLGDLFSESIFQKVTKIRG